MEDAEVLDPDAWSEAERQSKYLRSLRQNGEGDTPQADAIRDEIEALKEIEETEPDHLP